MHYNLPYKTKQFLFLLIKLSIVVGAFYFIYTKLFENSRLDIEQFLSVLHINNSFSLKTVTILLTLSICNWYFEILKWKHLVGTLKNISFKDALEQSLCGLTASLITPNRIGEYGAKAIYFAKPYRKRIVLLNLIGNISQMAITTILGIVGSILFVNLYSIEVDYFKITKIIFGFVLVRSLTAFGISKVSLRVKGYSMREILIHVKALGSLTHLKTLLFSLMRYAIFSFQFYYLLKFFGVDISYFAAMIVITSMYFLASIIPSISIFDVVVKGSVAVFLFSFIEVNELIVLSITTIMWLLNFALPSLFGGYYVMNFKLPSANE
ncbi:MAG: lysylphosphatidylglycerol synthase domain-containing protein [Winogradskyella sp.]